MSCSCHINPPCGYCEQTYECDNCGRLKHPDDNGLNVVEDKVYCDSCFEDICEVGNE